MRLIHFSTLRNTLYMSKTSCFGLALYIFSTSKDHLFQWKTSCFASGKVILCLLLISLDTFSLH